MQRLVRWIDSLPSGVQVVASSILQAAPFYAAALLTTHIESVAAQASIPEVAADAAVVVLLLTVVLAIRGYFRSILREARAASETKRAVMARAHDLVDRVVSRSLAEIAEAGSASDAMILFGGTKALNRIVEAVYELFEGAYGGAGEDAINFEATFMTKSYKDEYLTIPAHANKNARAPVSLQLRERNPKLYEQTVSALVFQQDSAGPRIVEDTERDPAYNALYEGQKKRIRSTIVYPVRDGSNRLLGTLVVHCDKPGFFARREERYWTAVLEVFAKRLALEKAKLDKIAERRRAGQESVTVAVPEFPF